MSQPLLTKVKNAFWRAQIPAWPCSAFLHLETRGWGCSSQKYKGARARASCSPLCSFPEPRSNSHFKRTAEGQSLKKTLQNKEDRLGPLEQTWYWRCWRAGWRSSITLRLSFAFIKAFCCRRSSQCSWVFFFFSIFFSLNSKALFFSHRTPANPALAGCYFSAECNRKEKQLGLYFHFPSWSFPLSLTHKGTYPLIKLISSGVSHHALTTNTAPNDGITVHMGKEQTGTMRARRGPQSISLHMDVHRHPLGHSWRSPFIHNADNVSPLFLSGGLLWILPLDCHAFPELAVCTHALPFSAARFDRLHLLSSPLESC